MAGRIEFAPSRFLLPTLLADYFQYLEDDEEKVVTMSVASFSLSSSSLTKVRTVKVVQALHKLSNDYKFAKIYSLLFHEKYIDAKLIGK